MWCSVSSRALLLYAGLTAAAVAQPSGPSLVAGQAQISTTGANTLITQSSNKAIINWQDFSVASGATVQFNQPGTSSITLNRVTGAGVSAIDGSIRSNGQVWLLNPNGILIGNGASINVGGLLATTSDITNQDFLAGRYNFSGGGGAIANNGTIQASSGGSVVLSAPSVTNRGLIRARAGHVVLAGTDTFTVDFNGDHLLSYAVGASSKTGSVTNSGKISAAGGQVLLTARAASGVQDAVINNSGMVEATSVRKVNGEIILDAGDGTATNAGTLDASGKDTGETGGTVKVLGGAVAVSDNAVIDVSGNAGGGTALIGGNFHGAGPERNARTTSIGKATITADATQSGNGGRIAVWSNGLTSFAGSISARGGASGGNGGEVETSGHGLSLGATAAVNTLAPSGKAGNWLLDPQNIIINNGTDPATGETFANNPSQTATLSPTSIDAALTTGNLTLQANNDITVAVTTQLNNGQPNTLTLQAGRSVLVNATLAYPNGKIVISANDPGAISADRLAGAATIATASGTEITDGNLDLILSSDGTDGSSIGSSSQPVIVSNGTFTYVKTLNANAYLTTDSLSSSTLSLGNALHSNASVDVGTGTITVSGASVSETSAPIFAGSLVATAAATSGTLSLSAYANVIGTANLQAGQSAFLYDAGNLSLTAISGATGGSTVPSGNVFVQATGNITIGSSSGVPAVNAGSTLMLHAGGSIFGSTNSGSGVGLSAPGLSLIADSGTIGTTSLPLAIATGNLAAHTVNQGITLSAIPSGTNPLTIVNSNTTGPGLIVNTSNSGINAGTGNVKLFGNSSLVLQSGTSGSITFGVTANNFAATGASLSIGGSSVSSFSATTSGAITFNNAGAFSVFDTTNLKGINATNLTLTTQSGTISQAAGAGGAINATGTLTASVNGSSGAVNLNDALNTISGQVSLNAPGGITFYNALNTTIFRANYIPASTAQSAGLIDIEVSGAGHTLTVGVGPNQNGTSIFGSTVTLHAPGAILQSGTGTTTANSVSLISDAAGAGTSSAPLLINAANLAASTQGDIFVKAAPGVNSFTSLNLGTVTNLGPGGGSVSGLNANAGSSNVVLNATSMNVVGGSGGGGGGNGGNGGNGTGINPVIANNLTITANSIGIGNNKVNNLSVTAPGSVLFFNNNDLIVTSVRGSNGASAASVVIQTAGNLTMPALTTTVQQNGVSSVITLPTIFSGGAVVLGASGSILGAGGVAANAVSLMAGGTIGAATNPINVSASVLAASTNNQNIYLFLQPASGSGGSTDLGSVTFVTSAFAIPTSIPLAAPGINAGTGNVKISASNQSVTGSGTITANNLSISAPSVQLDNVAVNSLSASDLNGGGIDISSTSGFQLNNLNGSAAISSTGFVSLDATGGSITQASGAAGAITAGDLSSFAITSNTLTNPLNAISGPIQFGSLGNASLYNSLSTQVDVALAGGTLTIQSGGDLTLLAGDTIATRSNGNGLDINNQLVLSASTFTNVNGTILSLGTSGDGIVLVAAGNYINNAGAAALQLPGGARFLVYSTDPASDTFGGQTTTGAGVFGTTYPAAVTATGNRYVFSVASSTNTSFTTATTAPPTTTTTPPTTITTPPTTSTTDGLTGDTSTAALPTLVGFVDGIQLAITPTITLINLNSPTPPAPVVVVVPTFSAPPTSTPLADLSGSGNNQNNNSEPPSSSDQATNYVANSLEGGAPPPGHTASGTGNTIIIPHFLHVSTPPPPATLTDTSVLSGFGNTSLWQ